MWVELLAQAAPAADASVWLNIPSAITSFGGLSAFVAALYLFLGYLRGEGDKATKAREEDRAFLADVQQKFQNQLDRFNDRQEQTQRELMTHTSRIADKQNELMRDTIIAMKSVESTVSQQGGQVRAIERTVDGLQMAIGTLDTLVKNAVGFRPPTILAVPEAKVVETPKG